jgi:hypothetical protein
MGWAGSMIERIYAYKILIENLKLSDRFGDLGIDENRIKNGISRNGICSCGLLRTQTLTSGRIQSGSLLVHVS